MSTQEDMTCPQCGQQHESINCPETDSGAHCAESPGSASFTTERKVLVALAWMCLITVCAALMYVAFMLDPKIGIVALAAMAWWLGSSIVSVLKDSRGYTPNAEIRGTEDGR